ncbi:hypothetical protein QQ045_009191 [Rhodiola kirilowii]
MSSVFPRLRGLFSNSRTATATATTKSKRSPVVPNKPRRHEQNLPTNSLPAVTDVGSNGVVTKRRPMSEREKMLRREVNKFKKASESEKFRGRFIPYETIVRRLVSNKQFPWVEEIIEHQKKYPEIADEKFCVRLLMLYGKAGMFDHARKLFDEMPEFKCERTVKSLNALLDACVESKQYEKFNDLIHELQGKMNVKPDIVTYNTIVKAFCQQGSLDQALSMIDVMDNVGVEADVITFNTLMEAFFKSGRVDDAEKIEEMMNKKNIAINIRTCNAKLRGLMAQRRTSDAVELFSKLETMGLQPDVYTFNALIQGFRDEENLEEAKRWYNEMMKCGIAPDKVTYINLIPLLCERGDSDMALSLCKQLIKDCVLMPRIILQMVVDELVSESKTDEATELIGLGKANKYFRYHLELLPNK